jgi:hypothetical protein
MSDDRDPLAADVSAALRRLASAAPQPRPDRLEAVVAGVRQRRQVRAATSTLAAAVVVVAVAVGAHSWHITASDHTVGPVPASSSPDPAPSSPAASALASAPAIASAAPAPSPTNRSASAKGLVVTVTVPTSVTVGEPARAVMTVTNKGSVATHGGAFTLVNAYAENGTQATGTVSDGHSTGCVAVAPGLRCAVATLEPGHSVQFWVAVAADQQATSIEFDIRWQYTGPDGTAVVTPFPRSVKVVPLPSSTPPASEVPVSSESPTVSSSPTASSS